MRCNSATTTPTSTSVAIEYVTELTHTGGYPQITKLIAELGGHGMWDVIATSMRDTTRFDRNLQRLLDGIERDLPGRRRR